MSLLSWISQKTHNIEQEKKRLKADLDVSIVRFERRRGEVEKVASDVMEIMHRRRRDDEKN
ncbi:MAG: hypothetical protein [Bacteriophage sp.]|nr:MAG: hypothetical protein [Bacteriophage sp.]